MSTSGVNMTRPLNFSAIPQMDVYLKMDVDLKKHLDMDTENHRQKVNSTKTILRTFEEGIARVAGLERDNQWLNSTYTLLMKSKELGSQLKDAVSSQKDFGLVARVAEVAAAIFGVGTFLCTLVGGSFVSAPVLIPSVLILASLTVGSFLLSNTCKKRAEHFERIANQLGETNRKHLDQVSKAKKEFVDTQIFLHDLVLNYSMYNLILSKIKSPERTVNLDHLKRILTNKLETDLDILKSAFGYASFFYAQPVESRMLENAHEIWYILASMKSQTNYCFEDVNKLIELTGVDSLNLFYPLVGMERSDSSRDLSEGEIKTQLEFGNINGLKEFIALLEVLVEKKMQQTALELLIEQLETDPARGNCSNRELTAKIEEAMRDLATTAGERFLQPEALLRAEE